MSNMIAYKMRAVFTALAFFLIGSSVFAADNSSSDAEDVYILDNVDVRERIKIKTDIGKTEISRDYIEALPLGNGGITDLLRISPAVQFDEGYRDSGKAGEITPAEISISGGKTYENLFLIDGMSNSSILDPGQDNPYLAADVTGHSQKYFLDSSVVDEIFVYDSNVPASFGGFTGGVVDVKTKIPAKEFSGKISYRTTSDKWTHFFIDSSERYKFNNSNDPSRQPKFEKHYVSASVNVPVTDRTRFLFSYNQLNSTIPLKYFNGWKDQERTSQTYLVKGVHNIDGSSFIDVTLSYSPYEGNYFIKNTYGSKFEIDGGGYFASVNYNKEFSESVLRVHANYSYSENSRKAPTDFYAWLATDNKPWGLGLDSEKIALSYEGGFGSIDKEEKNFKVGFEHNLDEKKFAGYHKFSYGADTNLITGMSHRLHNSYLYNVSYYSTGLNCSAYDYTCVEGEQAFTKRTLTPSAKETADIKEFSFFAEDQWRISRLELRLGLRASYDDFMNNANLSPRTQARFDILGSKQTILVAGYNRYYSSNLLANKLREIRKASSVEKRRIYQNTPQEWETSTDVSKVSYKFSNLDTPYSDEYMGGIEQKFLGANLSLKYIERRSDNEFARYRDESNADGITRWRMNNNGSSEYRSVQFKLERSWKKHSVMFNTVWQESTTSNNNYDQTFDLEDMNDRVVYKGKIIKVSEMPKDNYNRPIIVNLTYVGKFWDHLIVSAIAKYKGSYKQIELVDDEYVIKEGSNATVTKAYDVNEHDPSVTVDCSFSWEQPVFRKQKIILTMEVFNILNAKNKQGKSYTTGETADSYELGRQFWAGASYEF